MMWLRRYYLSLLVAAFPTLVLMAGVQRFPPVAWPSLSARPLWLDAMCAGLWLTLATWLTFSPSNGIRRQIQKGLTLSALLLLSLGLIGWQKDDWQATTWLMAAMLLSVCLLGAVWACSKAPLHVAHQAPRKKTEPRQKHKVVFWLLWCLVGAESLRLGGFGPQGAEKYWGSMSWLIWFSCGLPLQITAHFQPRWGAYFGLLGFIFSVLLGVLPALAKNAPLLTAFWALWLGCMVYRPQTQTLTRPAHSLS